MCGFCEDINEKEYIEPNNNIFAITDIDKEMSIYRTPYIRLDKVFYLKPEPHMEIHLFKGSDDDIMQVIYCPSCGRKLKIGD